MSEHYMGGEAHYMPGVSELASVAAYDETLSDAPALDESLYTPGLSDYNDSEIIREEVAEVLEEYPLTLDEAVGQANAAYVAIGEVIEDALRIISTDADLAASLQREAQLRIDALGYRANKVTAYAGAIEANPAMSGLPGVDTALARVQEMWPSALSAASKAREMVMSEYETVREQVVASIDWEGVIGQYLKGTGDHNRIPRAIRNVQPSSTSTLTYEGILGKIATMRKDMDAMAARDGAPVVHDAEPEHVTQEDIAETATWFRRMAEVCNLMAVPRHSLFEDDIDPRFARTRLRLLGAAISMGNTTDDTSGMPPVLNAALHRKMQYLSQRCSENDAVWRSRYLEDAPPQPEVRGEDKLWMAYNYADARQLTPKAFQDRYPTKGLRAIEYHETDPRANERIKARGGWFGVADASLHFVITIGEAYCSPKTLRYYTDHESAHYAQGVLDSIEQLFDWIDIVESEPDGAPEILKTVAKTKEDEKAMWAPFNEDYAYSVNDYHEEPYALLSRSARRFKHINDKYGLYYIPEEV